MNTVAMKTAENRRAKIVEHIKEEPTKIFSPKELAKIFNVTYPTIKSDLRVVESRHPEVDHVPKQGYKYNMKTAKKLHNSEGYLDTTAELAIQRVDSKNEGRFRSGEVWTVSSHGGFEDCFVVVAPSYSDTTACLQLYSKSDPYIANCGSAKDTMTLDIFSQSYVIDASKIVQKPNKYFLEKIGMLPMSVMVNLKAKIAQALTIDIEGEVVEKIVEKEVPVPYDANAVAAGVLRSILIVAGYDPTDDLDIPGLLELYAAPFKKEKTDDSMERALLKQKVEIYERLIFERGMSL